MPISRKRRLLELTGWLLLAALGIIGYSIVMLAALLVVPAALALLGALATAGGIYVIRRTVPPWTRVWLRYAALSFALALVWLLGYFFRLDHAERQLQPVIDAAQAHYAREGRYPSSPADFPRDVLTPFRVRESENDLPSKGIIWLDSPWCRAFYAWDSSRFDVCFNSVGFLKHSYSSAKPYWRRWD